jgi:hypothetical protein
MRHGVARVGGRPGTIVPFWHSAAAIPSRFGEPRDLRRSALIIRAGISPHSHKSGQPTDFAAMVARSWFPIREAETGM